MNAKVFIFLLTCIFFAENITAQETQISDQTTTATVSNEDVHSNIIANSSLDNTTTLNTTVEAVIQEPTKTQKLLYHIYKLLSKPIDKVISSTKVITVFKNIGTCIVNGFMDIVTYYFPAPFIPLIASAAGMVIPFEPVIMLRRRMPVTSYRRAIKTAVNSFLNTFDQYKYDIDEEDPYMTRRFNRRFMNENSNEKKTK